MKIHKSIILFSFMTASVFTAQAQEKTAADSDRQVKLKKVYEEPSFIFQAARYTQYFPELGITVMRDTINQKEFETFKAALSEKLTEKGIPHKFFIEVVNDNKGAAFAYFIKGRQYGVFTFDEFVALLPEAVRDYKKAFPKNPSEVQP